MAYSELIKSFDRIRDYMRQFYIYGFKSRTEYDKKSARSYDNERRRIESWLGDFMRFRQTPDGKNVFLSVDSRSIPGNPFYNAFKAKSFTTGDVTFHFYILDILRDGSEYTVQEILDIIFDEYLCHFESEWQPDISTIRKKLKEYVDIGVLKSEKRGRELYYSRVEDLVDLSRWENAMAFYAESDPLGVIGSTLLDKLDTKPEFFQFKHHYMLHALDSQILLQLLTAIGEKRRMGDDVSLLAKWLPSVNASNAQTVQYAKKIARFLGMTDATYRKTLVKLREHIRIIENSLREKDYSFDYSKQPSKAMFKYRKAFYRNDGERYGEFLGKVSRGEAQLHTGTLTPYEIIKPFFYEHVGDQEASAIDATWNAQEDFTRDENALVVIDGSGSMYSRTDPMPATVALSLGIYYAERNTGAFHNHFITFSERPQLVEIKGETILEKVRYCHDYNEVANTNIQKVFELILRAAVNNNVPQSEMPSTLYIISDMEFDSCARGAELTNFEYAKKIFAEAGYDLPRVVFWNVQSRNRQQPVTQNEQGVALVSGCSPRIFSMLKSGILSPLGYMLDILGAERYQRIAA